PVLECTNLIIYLRNDGLYELSADNYKTIAGDVTDNCNDPADITVSISPSTFSCSQAGQKIPVTVTASDEHGNISECEAIITVIDYYQPQMSCPEDIISYTDNGKCSSIVNFAAIATDD